ncbi:hypothetical protein N7475_010007 [Penicillium sp. IBT 31633x]|nr:hypothetical protein N7475_010007 [Penicillium sp. IBT 31633x]
MSRVTPASNPHPTDAQIAGIPRPARPEALRPLMKMKTYGCAFVVTRTKKNSMGVSGLKTSMLNSSVWTGSFSTMGSLLGEIYLVR